MVSLHAEQQSKGLPSTCKLVKLERYPRMVCGMVPRGCWKGGGNDGWEDAGVGCSFASWEGGGARDLEGCWRMETRSSTRRLEASGATPGRVTVHCWSRVALLRD